MGWPTFNGFCFLLLLVHFNSDLKNLGYFKSCFLGTGQRRTISAVLSDMDLFLSSLDKEFVIQEALEEHDKNGDGLVSLEEFLGDYRRDPSEWGVCVCEKWKPSFVLYFQSMSKVILCKHTLLYIDLPPCFLKSSSFSPDSSLLIVLFSPQVLLSVFRLWPGNGK